MPKYSVRFYSEYCQEYVVEALDPDAALELAAEYDRIRQGRGHADTARREELAPFVEVYEQQYVDHTDTMMNEVDADGNWIDEED